MKNRFIKAQAALLMFTVAGLMAFAAAAGAQLIDDTQAGVDDQTKIIQERQAEVRKGISIFNSIFQFPEGTPPATLTMGDLEDKLRGSYTRYSRIIAIASRKREHSYPALITFHEAAHWMDNRVLAPKFTPDSPASAEASGNFTVKELDAWRDAVAASETSKAISRLLADPKTNPKDKLFLQYVSSPTEMWARSLCQYLTIKSGDAELQRQLTAFALADWPYSGQWKGDDFAPIYRALDELFSENSWLKPSAALERDG